jgi:hypothetical protein
MMRRAGGGRKAAGAPAGIESEPGGPVRYTSLERSEAFSARSVSGELDQLRQAGERGSAARRNSRHAVNR